MVLEKLAGQRLGRREATVKSSTKIAFFQGHFTVFKWVYSRVILPYVVSHPSLLFTNLVPACELIVVVNVLAKHMAMDRIKVLVCREIRLHGLFVNKIPYTPELLCFLMPVTQSV